MPYFARQKIRWGGVDHEPGAMVSVEPIGNLPALEAMGAVMYAPDGKKIARPIRKDKDGKEFEDKTAPWMVVDGDADHADLATQPVLDLVAENAELKKQLSEARAAQAKAEEQALEAMVVAESVEALKAEVIAAEEKATDFAEAAKAAEARAEEAEAKAERAVANLEKAAPKPKRRKRGGE